MKLSKNENGLEKAKLFQEKTKECFKFADQNVCKICECRDGSCDCETTLDDEISKEN